MKCILSRVDKEFVEEYLTIQNIDRNLKLIYQNRIAFPNVKQSSVPLIRRLIIQKKYVDLYHYLLENNCLRKSILTLDFIKKTSLYNECVTSCTLSTSEEDSTSDEL